MSEENLKKEQEERAARLRRQIEELKRGTAAPINKFKNPRDFIAEKMRELDERDNLETDKCGNLSTDE